jgi:hypothetical protein
VSGILNAKHQRHCKWFSLFFHDAEWGLPECPEELVECETDKPGLGPGLSSNRDLCEEREECRIGAQELCPSFEASS